MEGAPGVLLESPAGGEGVGVGAEPPGATPGAAVEDGPAPEFPAGCDVTVADGDGAVGTLCTPVCPVGGGAVTPGANPGAYEIDGVLEPPPDGEGPAGVGLCTPVCPVGCGAVTPGANPGAYEIDGALEPPDGGDGAEGGEFDAVAVSLAGAGGAVGAGVPGATGVGAACTGPEPPAGCDGAVTHDVCPGVEGFPTAENPGASANTNVPPGSFSVTRSAAIVVTTAPLTRSPTPTT